MYATQEEALEVLHDTSIPLVMMSGEAGTGKSYVSRLYQQQCKERGREIVPTGSTGVAAMIENGRTVSSTLGLGIKESSDEVTTPFWTREYAPILREIDEIMVGEISMLGARTLDIVDQVLQKARKNRRPFGGVRIIATGDWIQLPPVNDEFAFKSDVWKRCPPVNVHLWKQYRAEGMLYKEVLRDLRRGQMTPAVLQTLEEARGRDVPGYNVPITHLVATNRQAKRINDDFLGNIPSQEFKFHAKMVQPKDKGFFDKKDYGQFFENSIAKSEVVLKAGAVVMVIVNDPYMNYVNGTVGVVRKIGRNAIFLEVDDSKGHRIVEVPKRYPFPMDKYVTHRDGSVTHETAVMAQVPLIPAWAITVHKSQGQTLERAVIDLSGGRSYSQLYVAMSRVKTMDGLYMTGKIPEITTQIHPDVLEYQEQFEYGMMVDQLDNQQETYI